MMDRKATVVAGLTGGIKGLFKGNGVDALHGTGKLLSGCEVEFTDHDGKTSKLQAEHVILAPGSVPDARVSGIEDVFSGR